MPPRINDDERIRRFEAVTDAALSRLDVSDLLDELLDRVRDLLDVDTAAVLLLDEHAQQLVATAAKGLEEEVRAGFRVAVGRGFAGRVAATRRPLRLAEVTADDVVNPILLAKGIRSLLGVPILAGTELIGVLHVGSLTPRRFGADDVRLMELVADRAGVAGRIRSDKMEQAAALALQRSLLPTRLPEVPGVELAARYVPGHAVGIGGDWYDVFPLPTGWLGVVIGDVSGHGLSSAVVMGRIRSALRSYALICDTPAEALTLLNRKVHHFEAGSLTTALYGMVSPERDRIVLSSAGHLRPVLARPGHPGGLAEVPVDPPLGLGRTRPRRNGIVAFPPGAVLLCYTDGLVERRDQVIDTGLAHLTGLIRAENAEAVCATAMSAVDTEQPGDDVAVLAVRRST
ncbi:cyclic diguanylate phosphodiesterase [Actinoplanes sp. SE50]|uniref:PP2C family protein-serine/threonine phosphatase n=1 Tax=unclassified Actinoplanes TaxID=2626549 RepID=UPI00023ED5A7|nr:MULTISPECIES: GAF domain-containing SpoIIE family protein phosphatase [unclassified Actinoplanes]AEV83374.1 Nif-specific regulatory protein [Actinoplanes sp. SE50/110]ATO81767.1 cyclic diguanylate phosphodiesterase [Actinoplanes sp. SE50]SLL99175.1 cyclic diguanylate phosphodiesterase [Actinoplanes sp. SE50/110]